MKWLQYVMNLLRVNKMVKIPYAYKQGLYQELMRVNIHREKLLSILLIIIIFILMLFNWLPYAMGFYSQMIFSGFSPVHVLMMVVPVVFLLAEYMQEKIGKADISIKYTMHLLLNGFVLTLCAVMGIINELMHKQPFPFIIAIICISSVILLNFWERCSLYLIAYVILIGGYLRIQQNGQLKIEIILFITLLVAISLGISHVNYASFLQHFMNHITIKEKNRELDHTYKLVEAALEKCTQELNQAVEFDRLRTLFFANISHELRTPLTVIFSVQQMLERILVEEQAHIESNEIHKYMRTMKQNCYRLLRLIANLIDITKMDAGHFHIQLQRCDIIKVVEDITMSVSEFIKDRGISLVFDTEVEELMIPCDPDKMERVILNLLSNAVKFTPPNGRIRVNLYVRDAMLEIHILDTGIGIPQDMLDSIFERFVQVDATISRAREGCGLGLFIVKYLVEMHHGKIYAYSMQGNGSEFVVSIPTENIEVQNELQEYADADEKQNIEKIYIEFSDIYI